MKLITILTLTASALLFSAPSLADKLNDQESLQLKQVIGSIDNQSDLKGLRRFFYSLHAIGKIKKTRSSFSGSELKTIISSFTNVKDYDDQKVNDVALTTILDSTKLMEITPISNVDGHPDAVRVTINTVGGQRLKL